MLRIILEDFETDPNHVTRTVLLETSAIQVDDIINEIERALIAYGFAPETVIEGILTKANILKQMQGEENV